jgi:WXG100 family type VII secretion target
MASIVFNYKRAINQASQIEGVATAMLNISNRDIRTALESIGACWQGEASQQFARYCTTMQTDIRAQAEALNNLAHRIRKVAKTIREAEERAMELKLQKAAAALRSGGSGDNTS